MPAAAVTLVKATGAGERGCGRAWGTSAAGVLSMDATGKRPAEGSRVRGGARRGEGQGRVKRGKGRDRNGKGAWPQTLGDANTTLPFQPSSFMPVSLAK